MMDSKASDAPITDERIEDAKRELMARDLSHLPVRSDPTNPDEWGGRLNIYTCEICRSHIVTRDVDEGVTPFMLPSGDYCPRKCASPKAGGAHMTSSFYRVWDQRMLEDFQWYRPDPSEVVPRQHQHHVSQGGLLIRRRPDAE